MFSQGMNQPDKGIFGKTFYFQTPLTANAKKTPLYSVTQKIGRFIRKEKIQLLESRTKADICVGFYQPQFHTFLTSTQLWKESKLKVEKLGLHLDPRFVREELFFNGALRALQTLNLNYDIRDLENAEIEELLKYRQLWVVSTEMMDADTQMRLASYVEKGGSLVIFPAIPTLDTYLRECRILLDRLGVAAKYGPSPNTVKALSVDEVYTPTTEKQIFTGACGEVVSTARSGEVCGFRKSVGKGTLTAFGFAIGYTSEEHLELYRRIATLDKVRCDGVVSDPDVQIVRRRRRTHDYLFILNYHNTRKSFSVDSKRYSIGPFGWRIIKRRTNK
jgi:beta-galactosidase